MDYKNTVNQKAIELLLEWLGSTNYKPKVLLKTLVESTSLGRRLDELKADTSTAGFDHWLRHRQLIWDILDHCYSKQWLRPAKTHLGRPAKNSYSPDDWRKALEIVEDRYHVPGTRKRAEYIINGPKLTTTIITLTDQFYEDFTNTADTLGIEGLTRDQIAEKLNCQRKVVNALVRILRHKGWYEKRVNDDGKRSLVLAKRSKNDTEL